MCSTWRCLLKSSESLIFIVTTFVNESNVGRAESEGKPLNEKLEIVKSKLMCKDPAKVLLDVISNNSQKSIVPIYSDIIRDGREMIEGLMPSDKVIDCLLNLATDKNILARLFVGFQAWI